ncbi:MAG: hypothetical protein COW00_00595 [Bdellovibrio sp. CG12_big_fil_rev_8_21_14_0_65_39_13]|nr:MAG: hypothetical protein COW78_04535 [Bdellovibrio sp. CG22_combo_CG10-13_8_21_14_all_39_27]PIQ62981.1 MAG: hypothetical protein COW00_00595 [Bdellovibrio sp. CG12_big_fil_rev_8_21_14_0_65_39_13]PIR32656.1 MAG: hypothetical protein COV37_19085 [Bdellovibrio sp. CG11_big_fil_rev_8_21_14_0_20_39_38]PJB52641.1 MAG: hypothetical protein CO099_11550 [Bdellovibrio sp. CG_4_9_14_3_um_filter_39_7]
MLDRRHFLKWGVLLAFMPLPALSKEVEFIRLFADVALQGSNYTDSQFALWNDSFQKAVSFRPVHEQEELSRLLSALDFAPSRWLLGGPWKDWSLERRSDLDLMLNSWKSSRFDLLKKGYSGLISLTQSSWYALDQSWPGIDYPGPPDKWWAT